MNDQAVPADWVGRFLVLLGLTAEAPSPAALVRITNAHLRRVPFENVTSLLRRWAYRDQVLPPLDLDAQLRAWEERRGGGVCYEVATMVHALLQALGYRVYPIIASIVSPIGHQAVVVEFDNRRYLVDLGNGAPFFDPIPLDGTFEIHHVGLSYRFRPGGDGRWVQDRMINGEWQPFCRYTLGPASPQIRDASFQMHHTPGNGWVMESITLVRCADDAVYTLRDTDFTRFTASGKTSEMVADPADYRRLATEVFALPDLPILEGLRIRDALRRACTCPCNQQV